MSTSIATGSEQTLTLSNRTEMQAAVDPFLALPAVAQRETERLTELLFFSRSSPNRKSVVLVDMDSASESSLWLANGMASVLSAGLRKIVYVLSLSGGKGESHVAVPNRFILERFLANGRDGESTHALIDRLNFLLSENHPVIVHLPRITEQASVLARATSIEGVVLLSRASKTRRAALESMARRLSATGVPLLGSVLLDRVHPIPDVLYRFL